MARLVKMYADDKDIGISTVYEDIRKATRC
jgi:hypothetical protein